MLLRGTEESEVIATIKSGKWESARYGKFCSRLQFGFGKPSPITQKIYDHKIVETIFAEEIDEIVVITVKVYYHN